MSSVQVDTEMLDTNDGSGGYKIRCFEWNFGFIVPIGYIKATHSDIEHELGW